MRGLALLLAATLAIGCASRTDPAEADPTPGRASALPCYRAAAPIRVDGDPNDPAWRAAYVIADFAAPWAPAGRRSLSKTCARLLWDDNYLYFLAEMEDEELVIASERHDDRLWLGDVLELFFKPRRDVRGYYELQVNPANARLDMYLPHRAPDAYQRWKTARAFAWQTSVRTNDTGWTVEGRIPWADFAPTGGAPTAGSRWGFALARYDYTPDQSPALSTNAILDHPNFHRHEEWPELLFLGASLPAHD